jgi:hypothetical protein
MNQPKLAFLFTGIVLSVVCAQSVYRGWQIVQFSEVATAHLTDSDRAAAFHPWISTEGLQYAARQASYSGEVQANDKQDAVQKGGEVTEILAVTPMSSAHWLLLSGLRSIARESSVWIIAALAMSNVTGANEGYLMPQRALFALSSWESLPSDMRPAAVHDLAQGWKSFTEPKKIQLRNILTSKSTNVRDNLHKRLTATGTLSPENLTQLGFANPRGCKPDNCQPEDCKSEDCQFQN